MCALTFLRWRCSSFFSFLYRRLFRSRAARSSLSCSCVQCSPDLAWVGSGPTQSPRNAARPSAMKLLDMKASYLSGEPLGSPRAAILPDTVHLPETVHILGDLEAFAEGARRVNSSPSDLRRQDNCCEAWAHDPTHAPRPR